MLRGWVIVPIGNELVLYGIHTLAHTMLDARQCHWVAISVNTA